VRERVVEHLLVDDVGESSLHASHGFHGRADLIFGGSGSDLVFAGRGDDMTRGGPDRDLLLGRSGADTIYGGSNIIGEILIGGRGADTIYDGAGRDNSSGNAGSDVIFGGSLGDGIRDGRGEDTLHGGLGNDFVILRWDGTPDTVSWGPAMIKSSVPPAGRLLLPTVKRSMSGSPDWPLAASLNNRTPTSFAERAVPFVGVVVALPIAGAVRR
jgi:RTX calcium-binding nonapeptide repeat (4 copies)